MTEHKWFKDFDFRKIYRKKIKPPFKPMNFLEENDSDTSDSDSDGMEFYKKEDDAK